MKNDEFEDRSEESEAVEAAKEMNDPDGPHPGVSDEPAPPADGDDPVPDLMG